MRSALVVLATLAVTQSRAHAEQVGVVVTGEATLQPQVAAQLEGWLEDRGRTVVPGPLEPSAINTLIDCFVLEDLGCARGLVDARAKTRSVIYAHIEVTPNEDGTRDIALTSYWFQKQHDAMSERRVCEHCTTEKFHSMVDDLMLALVHTPPVPVVLPADTEMQAPPPKVEPKRDNRLRLGLMAAGAVGLVAGTVLLAIDQDPHPTGTQMPTYRDTATSGVLLGLAGATTMVVGWSGRF
jgi:hypothetical protein